MNTKTAEQIAQLTSTVTDVATATPTEVDTVLAGLWGIRSQYEHYRDSAVQSVHRAIGERGAPQRGGWYMWPTLDHDAIAAARIACGQGNHRAIEALVILDGYDAVIAEVAAAATPFEARYETEQWNRYFWAQANGGHAHRTMRCSTCNKGRTRTPFNWHPELSGLTDADAIAKFGTSCCTVCFPDAPVGPKVEALDADACPGSRQAPVAGTEKRFGPSRTPYGRCTGCPDGTDLRVMAGSLVKKHKAPKAKK